jgi:hypothetical protein
MRHRALNALQLVVMVAAPIVCLALLPAHAQAAPRSCGGGTATGDSASAAGISNVARISLSIDHGASGTGVSVSGIVWPANTQITIDFVDTGDQNLGREAIALAKTDAAGAFHSPEFLAPRGYCGVSPGAGTVSLVVAHTSDGSVKAQARFTFVTSPELSTDLFSNSLNVKSTKIQVGGHSWGSAALVTLHATQEQVIDHAYSFARIPGTLSVEVRADATGAFQATVPLPAGLLPAIHVSVAATATSPLYGSLTRDLSTAFLVEPEMYPSVELSADAVARGGVLTITGEHWRHGDTVSIESCLGVPESNKHGILGCGSYPGGGPTLLARLTVGADGRIAAKAQIPRQARLGATGVRIYANDASLQWYDVTLSIKVVDAQTDDDTSVLGTSVSSLGTSGLPALAAGALALLLSGGLGAGYFVWRRRRYHKSAISGPSGPATQSGDDHDNRPAD